MRLPQRCRRRAAWPGGVRRRRTCAAASRRHAGPGQPVSARSADPVAAAPAPCRCSRCRQGPSFSPSGRPGPAPPASAGGAPSGSSSRDRARSRLSRSLRVPVRVPRVVAPDAPLQGGESRDADRTDLVDQRRRSADRRRAVLDDPRPAQGPARPDRPHDQDARARRSPAPGTSWPNSSWRWRAAYVPLSLIRDVDRRLSQHLLRIEEKLEEVNRSGALSGRGDRLVGRTRHERAPRCWR